MSLSLRQRHWIIFLAVGFSALYVFEPTSNLYLVKTVMESKLEPVPFISVKNLIGILLIYVAYKIFEAGRD